ncbi:hypothetical protein KW787_01395 [Candidatus Pacearchaeota archaeon]|nr:hypothetical protein [Candidatus Pacearchaeota archaeon]
MTLVKTDLPPQHFIYCHSNIPTEDALYIFDVASSRKITYYNSERHLNDITNEVNKKLYQGKSGLHPNHIRSFLRHICDEKLTREDFID